MDISSVPWGGFLMSALSGGLLKTGLDWISKKGRSKAYTMGAVDHAVQTAMGLVTDRLELVEKQNRECENNLREVKDDLAASKRDREELKSEIARLMAGPVAGFAEKAPT